MKHVFTNAMLAHVWAQGLLLAPGEHREQDHGRNAGHSFYFRDNSLLYRRGGVALITDARWHEGTRVVLINPDARVRTGYSWVNYASLARDAVHGLNAYTVNVPYVDPSRRGSYGEGMARLHKLNVEYLYAQYGEQMKRLQNPRAWLRWNGNDLEARTRAVFDAATPYREYCQIFGLQEPLPNFDAHISVLREAFARWYDPRAIGQRDRRAAYAHIADARTQSWGHAYLEGVAPYPSRNQLKRMGYRLAYDIKQARRPSLDRPNQITAAQWIEGKGDASALLHVYRTNDTTLLRRVGDTVQTSRGAEVPWAHAKRLFAYAQAVRHHGREEDTGLRLRVGHFSLSDIDGQGNVTIGCHRLAWVEMERLALREAPELIVPRYPLPAPRRATANPGFDRATDLAHGAMA
jgi:hypothetical protein